MAGAGRDYDSLLASVGELGAWHWLVLLCLVPPALLPGMWRYGHWISNNTFILTNIQ